MHGDRGGENIEVSVWMVKHRGAGRASFMWGLYVILECESILQNNWHLWMPVLHTTPGLKSSGWRWAPNLHDDGEDSFQDLNVCMDWIARIPCIFGSCMFSSSMKLTRTAPNSKISEITSHSLAQAICPQQCVDSAYHGIINLISQYRTANL